MKIIFDYFILVKYVVSFSQARHRESRGSGFTGRQMGSENHSGAWEGLGLICVNSVPRRELPLGFRLGDGSSGSSSAGVAAKEMCCLAGPVG